MKKRILSGILFGLCVLMTLVLLSAAAADTNPPQKLGGAPNWEAEEDVLDVFNVNKQMQIGENAFEINAGMRKSLGFTPEESGYYAIYSVGTYDTYGMLRDPDLNVYAEDDDSGQNRNFRMVYEMTANTPYIVSVQFYSQSDSGTVTVVLEKLVNPCGDNLTWSFDASTGTLTITGSGDMWPMYDGKPWATYVHDITSVSLPEGITSIAPFAFARCDNLTSINIPAGVTRIGEGAFMGCQSLAPEGISIDPYCTGYYIQDGALYFHGEGWGIHTYLAANPEKTYTITGNMDAVNDYAFADCDNLEAVTIDDTGLYDINRGMFQDCSSLEYAGLYNVDRIDDYAFFDCTSLRRIVITTDLARVYANAFLNCSALSHVYYIGTEAERNANLTIESTGNNALLNATWHYVDDVSTFMCGDYLFWYYNSEMHTLAIEGAGDMWDFEWKASPWFAYNDEMQVAVIDPDVTRIGTYAFMNCDEIVGFTLPQGLLSIGANAFENNHTMTEIEIPASVKAIEDQAFMGCDVLETLTLHEGLKTIGREAFRGCWVLNAFHIPASVTSIGTGVLRECYALTAENFTIEPGNTSYRIEDGVLFTYDYDILHTYLYNNTRTEYTVPENVSEIADFAFEENNALVTVRLPRFLFIIGECAFDDCENLATADLPSNMTMIGESAFSGTAIRIVRIPKNVTHIEPWTFSYCSSLTTIEIPKTVTDIGQSAFYQYQNAITDVYYTGTEAERNANLTIDNTTAYNNDQLLNATWHYETSLTSFMCGDDLYWEYDSRNRWLGIHGTGDMWDFPYFGATPWENYRTSVRSILIANSSAGSNVTSIGDFAFAGFTGVTSFSMPNSIRRIGLCALYDCTALQSVTLSNNLTEIGTSAFLNCSALETITLPESLVHIGSYAFGHCSAITSMTIPANVTDIEEAAFPGMDALPAFTVAEGNTAYCAIDGVLFTIDQKTLMQYPGGNTATSYAIPDGVEYVAEDAFAFNKHLDTVDVPDTVTSFARGVFACCEALESIILPDSITGVAAEMFTNCPALESIMLPGTITFVGDAAFYGCEALSDVYFIGTEEMRDAIEFNVDNEYLENATWHYIPIVFRTQTLTLEGRIGVDFFIQLPQDAALVYDGVAFTIDSIDGVPAFVPFSPDMPTNNNGYYKFTYYVRTIEMANTITVTLRYTLNGRVGTLEKTYSVKTYFETFDHFTALFNEKQRNMVKATADLGHYVQAFLAAQKGWTFGTDYAEMDKYYANYNRTIINAARNALAAYEVVKSTGTNVSKINYTLVLDSDTELRVYFKPAKGYTGTFTFTVNGETVTEDGEKMRVSLQSDGRYMVSIKNIAAHELSNVYMIKALSGGDEASITVSALSYANAMITGYADDAAWVNAAVAIYRYAAAAEAMMN